jgi:hypothetical protein
VATFCRLADTVGPRAVIWRYDPIVLTRRLDPAYHRRAFGGLARRLAGRTERVIVSIVDPYAKARRRLAAATHELGALSRDPLADPGLPDLIRDMAGTAREHGLDISSCAEGPLVARLGVRPGRCIDADYIREVFGIAVSTRKDPGQRPSCGCVVSRDIGACDTCLHGCLYCYATASPRVAAARHARHDPRAPALGPVPEPAPVQVQASPDRPGSG